MFEAARHRGFLTGFVSNGNATPEALDFIRPLTDCYKIDLKTMNDHHYRQLGGVLDHVLDAIGLVHERGIWLEVLTLVVPGFSDDPAELRAAARYIAGIDRDIPWHVTAFHEDYRFWGMGNTTAEVLVRACEIGAEEGLNFVYAGNVPGRVGRWEHTWCPACHALLVERLGYVILEQPGGCRRAVPRLRRSDPGHLREPAWIQCALASSRVHSGPRRLAGGAAARPCARYLVQTHPPLVGAGLPLLQERLEADHILYRRARRRPRTASTTTCSVLEAPETSSTTRRCSTCLRFALRRHRRDQSPTTARPNSPARVAHSITGCPRIEESPDDELVAEAKGGTGWASSRRDWRRASARKGEPAGRRVVTRDPVAESKRRRRPGRTAWLHGRGLGAGGTPSMYASQHTPSPSVNGIDSVRGFPRG